jgi:hypothetical protein
MTGKYTLAWLKKTSSNQNAVCPKCNQHIYGIYDKLFLDVVGECVDCTSTEDFDKIAPKLLMFLDEVGGW